MGTRRRGAYRPEHVKEIAALEARRVAVGVTLAELAQRASMTERTLMNIRASGRAWRRHIKALAMALRSLEQEHRRAAGLFPEGD